jgi:uncharacterized protein
MSNRPILWTFVMASTAMLFGQLFNVAQAQNSPPPPVFRGTWQGPDPAKVKLPGPGPAAGQSLPDYFAHLKTGPRTPKRFHVLVLGGTRGFHHDSSTAAMAGVYRWGFANGLWEAELVTDFELVNGGGGEPMNAGFQPKGLTDFDAVVVANASGNWGLTQEQKSALLGFVHEQGRGLVVIHAGIDANHDWRDYTDMVGGEFAGHPFNTLDEVVVNFPLVNEEPGFPAVAHLPAGFRKQDELYLLRNFDRKDVDVLLRLNERKLNFANVDGLVPPDHDMAIAWAKKYGNGRVFVSSIGHTKESFVDPDVEKMYTEAIKWVLGLTDAEPVSHAKRG